jgi:DNA-binding FrmR family transcriptional regulator
LLRKRFSRVIEGGEIRCGATLEFGLGRSDTMTDPRGIEAATRRLAHALDALDAAVERRLESDRESTTLAQQLHAASVDRSRLAADLDAQTAHARRLESATREVSQRIDKAMDSIRSVIEADERSDPAAPVAPSDIKP